MSDELKSLKKPTRILTIIMFIAVFITAMGADALGNALPFVPQAIIVGIVSVCSYVVTQYGTEQRVIRAEELKEQEITSNIEDNLEAEESIDGDGI